MMMMPESEIKAMIAAALPARSMTELRRKCPTITRLTLAAYVRHMIATGEIETYARGGHGSGYRAP